MKVNPKAAVTFLATLLLLGACAEEGAISSNSSSLSSSSSSSSSSQIKAKYSLSITCDDPSISVTDLSGNPLLNEYEEDAKVSFKIEGPSNYTIRAYLNDFQLKAKDGAYSFIMARNSNLVIEWEMASYHISFTGIEKMKVAYCDSDGSPLSTEPTSFEKGDDVYFTLAPNEDVDKRFTYFYNHCYEARIGSNKLEEDNGVYKIEGIEQNLAVEIITYEHEFEDGKCKHCHKSEEELAIHQTNETADVSYDAAVGGWKISAILGQDKSEIAIRKSYFLSLFDKYGDTLEISFGNGHSFGYDASNGNPMRTPMSMETRSETGLVKRFTDGYFYPDSLGDDGSDDYRSFIKVERADIEDEQCDGYVYMYFNYGGNSTFVTSGKDATEVYSAFIYSIAAAVTHPAAEPRPQTVVIGDGSTFVTGVTYQKDLGYVLTPATSGATIARATLSAPALAYYRENGHSKVTFEISEPFDGSSSNIATTFFSFAPWTSTGFNFAVENAVIGDYEKGNFINGDKTITTYKATFDLLSLYGERWNETGTFYFWFGIHFDHSNKLRDPAAYVHSITFAA